MDRAAMGKYKQTNRKFQHRTENEGWARKYANLTIMVTMYGAIVGAVIVLAMFLIYLWELLALNLL